MIDLTTIEKINAYLEILEMQATDLTTVFDNNTLSNFLIECRDDIFRLKEKCDMQAMILRRLTPENHPDTLFISGIAGERDMNNMPEKLLVVPAYGCDFAYVYQRTEKTTGPEW